MLDHGIQIQITGAKDAVGKSRAVNKRIVARLQKATEDRAEKFKQRLQSEMAREYTSQWATGRLARGITYKTFASPNGVDVQFFIRDQRELQFVTAALGGYFQQFPVGPFVITPTSGKALVFDPPAGMARRFIRGAGGRFAGSREGPIVVKKVLWGRRSGGFPRDVITEVSQEEAERFVQDVQNAVGIAIQEVTR